jgi:nitrite reductase (NADH) small subunit
MARWVQAARLSDFRPGSACELVVEDSIVALFNVDGQLYALDGVCPHQGGPLGRGCLTATIVTCPWHGWQFDVTNGRHQLNARLHQPTFALRVDGDEIWIDLDRQASD